jgi:hypothetical protein
MEVVVAYSEVLMRHPLKDSHTCEYHIQHSRLWTDIWILDHLNTKPERYFPATFGYIEIDSEEKAIITCISDYRRSLDLLTPYTVNSNYKQYRAIAVLHNLQFTIIQALGFSGFIGRILATELKVSRCD